MDWALLLGLLVGRLTAIPAGERSWGSRFVVDGTFGLYLCWVSVATVANITATLVDSGVDPGTPASEYLAVVVLAVAAVLGVILARAFGGRFAVAAAMAWGLGWIAVGRLTDAPESTITGVAAAVAAAAVVAAALAARLRPAPIASRAAHATA